MRSGLIARFTQFIATHLVAFCLLIFIVLGARLFFPAEERAASARVATPPPVTSSAPPASADVVEPEAPSPPSASQVTAERPGVNESTRSPPGSAASDYTPPRMIGGTLPNYQQSRDGSDQGQGTAFRPRQQTLEPPPNRDAMVQRARRAFWNGDAEGAEAAYKAVLAAFPDDADTFGELGSLYQSTGRDTEAMDAYYEAAVRLKAAGEGDRLRPIIEYFEQQGDPRVQQLAR